MFVVKFHTSRKLVQDHGAMKPYFSGAKLSVCAPSTTLTFTSPFLCRFPRLLLFVSRFIRFSWWRRTTFFDLISHAGSWWSKLQSHICIFCFRFDIRCFVTLRNNVSVLNNSFFKIRYPVLWQYTIALKLFLFVVM